MCRVKVEGNTLFFVRGSWFRMSRHLEAVEAVGEVGPLGIAEVG